MVQSKIERIGTATYLKGRIDRKRESGCGLGFGRKPSLVDYILQMPILDVKTA